MWLVVGLAGPVLAFYLLGAAGFVLMFLQASEHAEEDWPAATGDGQPERVIAWLALVMCALPLGLADGLLAAFVGGPIARAAVAGAVAGASAAWPLARAVLSGFVSLWVLALVFALNVAAMALAF